MNNIKKALNESAVIRWTALILISIVMFSSYYFYDVYSAIKEALQNQAGLSNTEYGSMYGAYSFLNAFGMAFIGGMLLDKWGIRKTGIIFLSFLLIGTVITAYGSSSLFNSNSFSYGFINSFWKDYTPALKMMVLGRILFGLGAETFYVVINKVIAKWFKGHELALAFSISLALGRFGTAAAFMYSPRLIANSHHFDTAPWFGVMLVLVSFILFFVYLVYDFRFDKSVAGKNIEEDEEEKFHFNDVAKLFKNRSFIYITLLCVTFYSAVFPFLGFAADFLHNKFAFSLKLSGDLTTILPYGTILFTPLFGWFTDHKGKNASVMIWGSLLLILVHLTFAVTSISPYVPLFVLGVAFSLVPAAMWPSVARIVDENSLGTAYGIMFSIQNWGLMLFPYLIGKVLDISNKNVPDGAPLDYTNSILMLAVLGVLGIVFALLLKREDKVSGYGLELPNKKE
ncbi:MAG: MFS transporter [Bacteroidetes bacterium]|nr:MFS transporter [Bacteroidota bacterium]